MNEQLARILVVTDLDGTLLDHHSYSSDAAASALARLSKAGIPLILNSSKTSAEMQLIRQELANTAPYIVENGAAICFPAKVSGDQQDVRVLGMPRDRILQVLHTIALQRNFNYQAFSAMSVEQLIECTGLSRDKALLALAREFTEPLLWRDTESSLQAFSQLLQREGLTTVRGGRFVHVSAPVNKASPFELLKQHYHTEHGWPEVKIIALGDGDNDIAMLEAADYAVAIRSPVKDFPQISHNKLIKTEEYGPAGWNAAIHELLNHLAIK